MRLIVLQRFLSLFCQKCGIPQIKIIDQKLAESVKNLPFEKRVSFFWNRLFDSHFPKCCECGNEINLVKFTAQKDSFKVYLNCPKTNEPVTMELILKFLEPYDDSFYINIGEKKEQLYENIKNTKYVWVPKQKEKENDS